MPQGYKMTSLGVIPQDWEEKKLGDIAEINPRNGEITSQFVTFLTMSDISEHGGIIKENIIPNISLKPGFTSFKKGDIIIAKITPCFENGKGALLDNITEEYGFGSTEFHVIRSRQCNHFIYFHTISYAFRKRLESQMTGSAGQKRVPADSVSSYKLPVPPLPEQQKIAEVLGTWDKAIEKQSQLIKKLELRKKGLMQHLLTGKKRLPGFNKKWEKIKLGKIGKFDKGFGVPKDSIKENGNKAITYGEIYTKYNYVIKNVASYIDDETASISKKITRGAILFTGSGETLEDIGKCVAFIDNDVAYAGGDIIIFNPSIGINSVVLSYCLNSSPVNAQKWKYGQGFSVVHIYQKDLAKIQIEIPSLEEQTAIAQVLTAADHEIELAQQKLELLRQQKRGLMQQLLTGKKRIKI